MYKKAWCTCKDVALPCQAIAFLSFSSPEHLVVGCYMLRPFAHPVACCWMLLHVVAQSLKPDKILAPCKGTQHCWDLLSPFARSFKFRIISIPCNRSETEFSRCVGTDRLLHRRGGYNFRRGLILGGQFWKRTCEGGQNFKTQDWHFM